LIDQTQPKETETNFIQLSLGLIIGVSELPELDKRSENSSQRIEESRAKPTSVYRT
jgi:hypothetical protein